MDGVFANRTAQRDFLINELQRRGGEARAVFIAVAFFTEADLVLRLLDSGCQVRLVVRLGFPTSPVALEKVMRHANAQVRVFTARSFHPKLYIFGDEIALVGSANLTHAAVTTNQEVTVSIDAGDARFTELTAIFQDYWDQADVPTDEMLRIYKQLYQQYKQLEDAVDKQAHDVADRLGNTAPANVNRGRKALARDSLFESEFRRTYQECVAAFNLVRRVYERSGYRKVSEASIPLRLEIDSFMSFVRQRIATGESWLSPPLRTPKEQEPIIAELIERWRETPWPYFEETIVGDTYPALQRVFSSADAVMAADDDALFNALSTLHSFGDRQRFFEGGRPTWRNAFVAANDPQRARESLAQLVFGPGDVVKRMARMIYGAQKLNEFGPANVQELIGWCNREELPILNSRTTKMLRFFGSEVRQLR